VAQATQLNATEQDTLVKQIGLSLLRAAPRDWQRVTAEYRAVGRFHELTGEIVLTDGSTVDWVATHDIATLFGRLRAGMYREGRGTWFNARYQLDHPSSYNLEYDREEPRWDIMPPPQAYADELRTFPRSEDNVPEWLMRRMSGLGPERPGPRFRIARIFDGAGPGGRPVLNRPELEVDEQDRLLDYLDSAPVVVPSRGYDIDRLATTPDGTVPVAFHSDGVWIWPAAVNYYLREYGVSPEPELIQHIHASGFAVPAVPDQVRHAAAAHINRGAPPPRQGPPPVAPPQADGSGDRPPARPFEEPPAQPQRDPRQQDPTSAQQHEPPHEEEFDQTTYAAPVIGEREFSTPAQAEPAHDDTQYHEPRFDDYDDEGDDPPDYQQDHQDSEETGVEHGRADQSPQEDTSKHRAQMDPPTTFTPAASMDPGPLTTITPPVSAPVATPDLHATETEASRADAQRAEPQETLRQESRQRPASPHQDLHQQDGRRFEPSHVPDRDWVDGEPGHRGREFDDIGPPTQVGGVPLPEHAEPVLDKLQDTLRELGVPDSAYRIGMPAEHGWSVEEVSSGWRVGWYEGKLTNPAMFGDAEDAAAFMLGKLLLAPDGGVSGIQPPPAAAPSVPQPPPLTPVKQTPLTTTLSPDVATGARSQREPESQSPVRPASPPSPAPTRESAEPAPARPAATFAANGAGAPVPPPPAPSTPAAPARPAASGGGASGGGPGAGQQWPIQPMDGEPPLTLFRGKELRELPAGSELDRFGGPNGNLTYAAGTPFEERSLVPEWVNRPYHVYRVQRPLEALAGVSIPWFNQPGGGAAYLLPTSIEELVAEGDLIELEPGERPVD
jgi:hypothetical protein